MATVEEIELQKQKLALDEVERGIDYFHAQSLVFEGAAGNNLRTSLNSVSSAVDDLRRLIEPETTQTPVIENVTRTTKDAWEELTEEERQSFLETHTTSVTLDQEPREREVMPWNRTV